MEWANEIADGIRMDAHMHICTLHGTHGSGGRARRRYYSPYPEAYIGDAKQLFICEFCLKYFPRKVRPG